MQRRARQAEIPEEIEPISGRLLQDQPAGKPAPRFFGIGFRWRTTCLLMLNGSMRCAVAASLPNRSLAVALMALKSRQPSQGNWFNQNTIAGDKVVAKQHLSAVTRSQGRHPNQARHRSQQPPYPFGVSRNFGHRAHYRLWYIRPALIDKNAVRCTQILVTQPAIHDRKSDRVAIDHPR